MFHNADKIELRIEPVITETVAAEFGIAEAVKTESGMIAVADAVTALTSAAVLTVPGTAASTSERKTTLLSLHQIIVTGFNQILLG